MAASGKKRDASVENTGEAAGLCIRPMEDEDLERILRLRSVVHWAADPRAFGLLRGMADARWAVAEDLRNPDALAGMVGAVPLAGGVGILCHLAVHRDYREAGVGSWLSAWAISYLRSRGTRLVRLDSTREAERLYRSLGFSPVGRRTVYRLAGVRGHRRPGPGENSDARRRVGPLTGGDLPELYGLDRWSYGTDRSALIATALELYPGRGFVARDAAGRMEGYLILNSRESVARIGPFMAAEPAIAGALLASALEHVRESTGDTPVEVTVPGGGPAHRVLGEFGFTGRPDRLRMELRLKPHAAASGTGLQQYGTTQYLAT